MLGCAFVALGPRPSTERGLWVLATAERGRSRGLGRVTKATQHSHSLHILVLAGNPPQTTSVFARPPPPFHTFLAAHLQKAFLSGNGVKLLVEPQRTPPLHPILPAAFCKGLGGLKTQDLGAMLSVAGFWARRPFCKPKPHHNTGRAKKQRQLPNPFSKLAAQVSTLNVFFMLYYIKPSPRSFVGLLNMALVRQASDFDKTPGTNRSGEHIVGSLHFRHASGRLGRQTACCALHCLRAKMSHVLASTPLQVEASKPHLCESAFGGTSCSGLVFSGKPSTKRGVSDTPTETPSPEPVGWLPPPEAARPRGRHGEFCHVVFPWVRKNLAPKRWDQHREANT